MMKKINQKAAKVFNNMIALMNGEQHLKIDNTEGSFMPLSIEQLGSEMDLAGRKVIVYSLAHYYKQNGDLVPDPDMKFAVSQVDGMYIWAMTYQDYRSYQEGIYIDNGTWKLNKRIQNDHADFAGQWLINIKNQQNL